jgi:hypothetical protein
MRNFPVIAFLFAAATTAWIGAGYFGANAQQLETHAELLKIQSSGLTLTDAEIAILVSRMGQQGRNWAIPAVMSAATASLLALTIVRRPRHT